MTPLSPADVIAKSEISIRKAPKSISGSSYSKTAQAFPDQPSMLTTSRNEKKYTKLSVATSQRSAIGTTITAKTAIAPAEASVSAMPPVIPPASRLNNLSSVRNDKSAVTSQCNTSTNRAIKSDIKPPLKRNPPQTKSPMPVSKSQLKSPIPLVVAIAVGLLVSPAASKRIENTKVADIHLTICHVDKTGVNLVPTQMDHFIDGIADIWPLDPIRTWFGVFQVGKSDDLPLLIPDGNSPQALKGMKPKLMPQSDRSPHIDRHHCDQNGIDKGHQELFTKSKLHPNERGKFSPKVHVGVTVYRMDDPFADKNDWETRIFVPQTAEFDKSVSDQRHPRGEVMDVYVVLEADKSYYGVIWNWRNGTTKTDCCYDDGMAKMAERTFAAVQTILRQCVINENETCYLDEHGNRLADVTHGYAYTDKDPEWQYCDVRANRVGVSCSTGGSVCGLTTMTHEIHDLSTTASGVKIAWGWLGPCLTAVVIAIIRQVMMFLKMRRQEKSRLRECGLVCMPRGRRGSKSLKMKSPEHSSTSDSKMGAVTKGPAVLNRQTMRTSEKSIGMRPPKKRSPVACLMRVCMCPDRFVEFVL